MVIVSHAFLFSQTLQGMNENDSWPRIRPDVEFIEVLEFLVYLKTDTFATLVLEPELRPNRKHNAIFGISNPLYREKPLFDISFTV